MAREFAKAFYHSSAWKKARKAYIKKQCGLCERCLRMGKITVGNTVHHKIHLNPQNINDVNISLSEDNFELLCPDCHAYVHRGDKRRSSVVEEPLRVLFDESGNVVRR